jgi:hypothetical protein
MATESIEFIVWQDSASGSESWRFRSEYTPEIAIAESVGFVVQETDELVCLVPHIAKCKSHKEDQFQGMMTIPKSAILRRFPLKQSEEFTEYRNHVQSNENTSGN